LAAGAGATGRGAPGAAALEASGAKGFDVVGAAPLGGAAGAAGATGAVGLDGGAAAGRCGGAATAAPLGFPPTASEAAFFTDRMALPGEAGAGAAGAPPLPRPINERMRWASSSLIELLWLRAAIFSFSAASSTSLLSRPRSRDSS
jgi:hypothetical protein